MGATCAGALTLVASTASARDKFSIADFGHGLPNLPADIMENIVYYTGEDLEKILIQESYNKPVLLYFHAEWCPPCRTLTPYLERTFKSAVPGSQKVIMVDIDEYPKVWNTYRSGIGVPLTLVFAQGHAVDTLFGPYGDKQLGKALDKAWAAINGTDHGPSDLAPDNELNDGLIHPDFKL